jgi:hypothetical protein
MGGFSEPRVPPGVFFARQQRFSFFPFYSFLFSPSALGRLPYPIFGDRVFLSEILSYTGAILSGEERNVQDEREPPQTGK